MGCDFGGFNQQKQGRQKETIVDRNVGELVGQITTIMIFLQRLVNRRLFPEWWFTRLMSAINGQP
jgi:phage-related protein